MQDSLAHSISQASRIVARVIAGGSLADEADSFAAAGSARGAVMDLVHGTLRRYGRGSRVISILSSRPDMDLSVRALLLCSLYALESTRYSDHAAVDQAVMACRHIQKDRARGFVNAILRSRLRRRQELELSIEKDEEATYMHPRWWVRRLQNEYPGYWQAILESGNTLPPMGLRINRRVSTVEAYMPQLASQGLTARPVDERGVVLDRPVSVDRLPGFFDGTVSVQDTGAQRAAHMLDLHSGQRVLDACAAPGGKSGHILELADVDLLALDIGASRCTRVHQNLARLKLKADVVAGDCTQPEVWWDGRGFDRILADVPCSGSGVVRRHPDIKWLRRETDLMQFARTQARILDALWQYLLPGGKLLYVTCSVFAEENSAVVEAFQSHNADAIATDMPGTMGGVLLPSLDHDGFYFALIEKRR